MIRLMMIVMLISISLFLSSCETTRGVGRDLEQTGENIQGTSEDVQDEY